MIDWVRSWVMSICVAVIFITAVELIIPSNKFKGYVKFVMGLILIAVILNPIIKIFNNKTDITTYIDKADQYVNSGSYESNTEKYKNQDKEETINAFKENLQKSCSKMLKDKFPNNDYEVKADVKLDDATNQINIKGLSIGVKNEGVEKIENIEIDSKSVSASQEKKVDPEVDKEIKDYLNNELKISKDSISIYKQ
ncbi:stage III sporulation protein AF [Clostridium pasteurianum DSM 525 = ATCC 6013]|uniref:Stage III sporulation protein AF n=1 Tax=Clostridium pasteurianum DSM 525 = ATCC 6013 TaxID=1262449 RepID=A0A0H3J4Q6_CLOPA|nr:stage III sporulation protein AF [Clostridium pasteurianum]AJA47972.1 stage III sporulation protein AF [Clostridium pasteurianum DSM 525 = ATCC 6013]AJA51960.1 stage III sporulation protein AF [Clostridium pasteurianum DSM 525 = ATCC 6013]AOZ75257.1 stage III sporulation protein AF [Clostridium pasteurianum DSM 525 = ATCC 6013]AOZ79052.1 stage III sporulation protein AF [Clostridium pasteurianum]ELP59875.1 stage III sporulation protein AF [Clostridium pasteurianum DSM 525 = ATCC 6013]